MKPVTRHSSVREADPFTTVVYRRRSDEVERPAEPKRRPAKSPPPPAGKRASAPTAAGSRVPAGLRLAPALAVFIAALLLRYIHLQQAHDVFIDEITYSRIAESVAIHHTVAFFGAPFWLHPPVVFLEQALFIDAFHVHGSAFAVVFALRAVNVLFAAASAVFILRIVTRVAGSPAGIIAAGLFAIDPFLIRFDGRVFLEPGTMFWVLAGYYALFTALQATDRRRRNLYGVLAGLAMGVGILSNEIALPLIVLPLGCCLVIGRPFPRRAVVGPAAALIAVGGAFLLAIVAAGELHVLVTQQLQGVQRLVGANQATGFNRPGAPSFLARIETHLGTFGAVYVVMALSLIPALYYLWRGDAARRLIALVAFSAYTLIGYQIVFGTLEEQMFYYVDIPAILVGSIGLAHLLRRSFVVRRSRLLGALAALTVTALVAVDAGSWVAVHTTRDDALRSAIAWIDGHVPAGTRVAPLVDTSQLLLNNYQVFVTKTPEQIEATQPAIAITSSLQVDQGYGFASTALTQWLRSHATAALVTSGRTFGTVTVWRLPYEEATGPPPGSPPISADLPAQPVGQG